MKRIQYIVILLLISSTVWGQNLVDALRYSDYRLQGTARASAMGNAFGSLGGDFTSASINPAGIGLYRSNEFVFTPTFGKTDVDGSYLGNSMSESKYNIGMPNLGYVATFNTDRSNEGSLVSVSIGLGYNRLNNYNIKKLAEGVNANTSLLDNFTANANDGTWSDYYEELAWQTDLLLYDTDADEYWNDIAESGHGQSQRKTYSQKGNINEYILSVAANFNHKFYVGATLGIHDLYFRENTSLFEYDANDNIPFFNDYTFNTYLNTTGTGYNVKFGAIFKPIDELRLGLAFHSPTFYKLHDSFDNSMYSYITYNDGSDNLEAYSPLGDYDYELETPMKAIFSAAYIVGKSGLISVDYELVDYSSVKLRDGGDGYDFFNENQEIQEAYKAVGNLHIGAEYRVADNFSLRAGYENYPSPFNSNAFGTYQPNSKNNSSSISGGFGWKQGGFFFDVAYKHELNENYHEVYTGSDLAKFKNMSDNVSFTLGFRF